MNLLISQRSFLARHRGGLSVWSLVKTRYCSGTCFLLGSCLSSYCRDSAVGGSVLINFICRFSVPVCILFIFIVPWQLLFGRISQRDFKGAACYNVTHIVTITTVTGSYLSSINTFEFLIRNLTFLLLNIFTIIINTFVLKVIVIFHFIDNVILTVSTVLFGGGMFVPLIE